MLKYETGTRSNFAVDVREWITKGIVEGGGFFSKSVTTVDELSLYASGYFKKRISPVLVGKILEEIRTLGEVEIEAYGVRPWGLGNKSTTVWILRRPEDYRKWSLIPPTKKHREQFGFGEQADRKIAEDYLIKEYRKAWK